MTTDQAEPRNRRRSKRTRARIRILFTREGTGVAIEAATDDVSVDGVFVRTQRRPPDVGTKLGLLLKLEDPSRELMLRGIVSRVSLGESAESEQTSQGMGIHFLDVDDATRRVLTQALEGTDGANASPREVEVDADDLDRG